MEGDLTVLGGRCVSVLFQTVMTTQTSARPRLTRWLIILCVFMFSLRTSMCFGYQSTSSYRAMVNITYKDPTTSDWVSKREELGFYGPTSRLDAEWGWVVHVRTVDNKTHGCTPPVNFLRERWIALVQRGSCKFQDKIYNAAILRNASAVVIYNNVDDEQDLAMSHAIDDVVAIFVTKNEGERIAQLVDNNTRVLMHISLGSQSARHLSNINKTSVLFVSISFIVLMIISLAWLVFYYIQRFRYAHAKERLSKRLMSAAKKAITKMPLKTIKNGDQETESDFDQCAVCIENYRSHDVVRILPCMHMFHKSCVDPWLIEQRSCPMCKMDILKAYGLQIHGSRDSIANIDMEVPSTSIGPSELAIVEGHHHDTDCDSLEIVRYQPAQVEYHDIPASHRVEVEEEEGAVDGARVGTSPPPPKITSSNSMEFETENAENSERQHLMSEEHQREVEEAAAAAESAGKSRNCDT